jgi:uncharacterized protein (TIGR02453 family)
MTFAGIPADFFAFFSELRAHNDREWWLANKARYETSVRAPIEQLAAGLEPEFGPIKVFRPYQDLRFHKDRDPYKTWAALGARRRVGEGSRYLELSDQGLLIGGGFWQPTAGQLERFRGILRGHEAEDLLVTLDELGEVGFTLSDANMLATAPRGWSADHQHIDLLRRKNLSVRKHVPVEKWMSSPTALDRIAGEWRHVVTWGEWLEENVGA